MSKRAFNVKNRAAASLRRPDMLSPEQEREKLLNRRAEEIAALKAERDEAQEVIAMLRETIEDKDDEILELKQRLNPGGSRNKRKPRLSVAHAR